MQNSLAFTFIKTQNIIIMRPSTFELFQMRTYSTDMIKVTIEGGEKGRKIECSILRLSFRSPFSNLRPQTFRRRHFDVVLHYLSLNQIDKISCNLSSRFR